jgi:hypothetical protein
MVSGTITVTATASDNVAVASVQFQVDGSNLGGTDTSAPYSASLNTTTLANGNHTLTAVATDTANNKTTSSAVSITVNNSSPNQPTVAITSPLAGTTISGTTTVTATASDSNGIASVQFQVDGTNLGAADTTSPYSQSWNTTTVADGTHILTAVATSNGSSQQATTSTVVIVNNSGSGPVLSSTPGWHKIPGTALCGGPENANALTVPNNFPANLGSYTSYGFPFADTCYDEYDDSSTAIVDTLRKRMIFWGGGHNGYWGNDIFDLEISNIGTGNPLMLRLDNPANPNNPVGGTAGQMEYETLYACSYVTNCTPTINTPGSRHTYNNLAYIPSTDQMLSFGGALTPNGYASSDTWLLNMSSVLASCAPGATALGCNPAWSNVSPTSGPIGNQFNYVNYDANHDVVWVADNNNSNGIWIYNYSTNAYTQVSNHFPVGYHSYSVFDPIDQLVIVIGGGDGVHYFSTASLTSTTLVTPILINCSGLTVGGSGLPGDSGQYPGLAWDPIGKVVVVYMNGGPATGGQTLYLLDPKTWACTSETYGSVQGTDYPQSTPNFDTGDMGTFGHFQYIAAYDIFVLCNDPHEDCWYFRPKR